jgi:hypothetical protein
MGEPNPTFCLHSGLFRIETDFLKQMSILDRDPDTDRPDLAAS